MIYKIAREQIREVRRMMCPHKWAYDDEGSRGYSGYVEKCEWCGSRQWIPQ